MRSRPYQERDTGAWVNLDCRHCGSLVDVEGFCPACDAELLVEMSSPVDCTVQPVDDPWGTAPEQEVGDGAFHW